MADETPEEFRARSNAAMVRASFLRGSLLTGYAHIEFLLADICLKSWELPEYAHLKSDFPYKTESRIKAVNALLRADGPLKQYQAEFQPVLDRLPDFAEIRHFAAHGLQVVRLTSEDETLLYRLYRTSKLGPEIGNLDASMTQMEAVVHEITALLHQVPTTFRRIYRDVGLPWDHF
jgi:hypothetical protein